MRITAITMRRNPIYLSTYTGRPPDEPSRLGEAFNDVFLPVARRQFPEIVDLWLPPEACSYRIAVASIKKRYPGQARRLMMGLWSMLPQFSYTKLLIIVDDDVDVRDWADVMWAVSTRCRHLARHDVDQRHADRLSRFRLAEIRPRRQTRHRRHQQDRHRDRARMGQGAGDGRGRDRARRCDVVRASGSRPRRRRPRRSAGCCDECAASHRRRHQRRVGRRGRPAHRRTARHHGLRDCISSCRRRPSAPSPTKSAPQALAHTLEIVDRHHDFNDVGASIASGSFRTSGMIVAPCSIRTLSAIATGNLDNLLVARRRRAAQGAPPAGADAARDAAASRPYPQHGAGDRNRRHRRADLAGVLPAAALDWQK